MGTWYLLYEVQLFTVRRELQSLCGEDREATTKHEFRFALESQKAINIGREFKDVFHQFS